MNKQNQNYWQQQHHAPTEVYKSHITSHINTVKHSNDAAHHSSHIASLVWSAAPKLCMVPKSNFHHLSSFKNSISFLVVQNSRTTHLVLDHKAISASNTLDHYFINKADKNLYVRKPTNLLLSTNIPLKPGLLFLAMTFVCDNNAILRCTTFQR